jgi:DNA invertase Pin-like site-specific DNA recombinase
MAEALAMVRKTGAELLVAKLDRLSRKMSLIASIMDDKKVRLLVASMPHADKFQLHIYGALAEQERDFISKRTKAALAAAKTRGVKLGGYRPGSLDKRIAALKENADADARRVIGIIQPMRQSGMSLRAIATELDKQRIETPRGGRMDCDAGQEHARPHGETGSTGSAASDV